MQPIDLIKTRIQVVGKAQNIGAVTIAKNLIKNEGVMKLYAGLSASLMRQAIYGTARLGLHRVFSNYLKERNNGSLTIVKDGDKEVYPFAFGKNALIELKEKSSSPALSSASYNSDGTLSIWVQFIGECLGGLTIEIGIKEKRISMRMRLVGELMFEGYSGVLTGTLR